jgi:hypothetical protein
MTINDKFYMPGTERTGQYIVLLVTSLGRVGYRDLGSSVRVRIEPASRAAGDTLRPHFPGYKEGIGGQEYRFSTVVDKSTLPGVLENAVRALVPGGNCEINPAAPDQMKAITESCIAPAGTRAFGALPPPHVQEAMRAKGSPLNAAELSQLQPESEDQERARLVAEVRARKLPGANAAARWSLATLRAKLAQ